MDNPRPEKVAVVQEVKDRISNSTASLLTEYRGLTVTDMQVLRRSLRAAGGDYKIYKNTLVRFAARELDLDIEELLLGPTAIAFVPSDGPGDPVPVAKALRDFARVNANLVVKGGVLGDKILGADEARALAEVAPREVLLAQLAGAMAAPMQQFASLLNALPQKFAYAMQALIDHQGGAPSVGSGVEESAEVPLGLGDDLPGREPDDAKAESVTIHAEANEDETPSTTVVDASVDNSGAGDMGSNTEES